RLFYDVWQTFPPGGAMIPKPTESSTHFFYAGFLVVLLTTLIARDERPNVRRLTIFFGLAAALFFAKLMGIPPARGVPAMPVFKLLHFVTDCSGGFGFALAGLAACGVEALVGHGPTRWRFPGVVVVAGALLGAIVVFASIKGFNPAATPAARAAYG